MRTGKCLSAETIMSRGLPGTPVPRSFSSTMARSRMAVQNQKQTTSNILALKRGCLGRRQDGVPRIGRYRSVKPLIPNHVHRIQTVAHPLDLLAQCVPQHRNACIRCREVFEGMHGDHPMTFLSLEIIGLALAILVFPR